MPWPTTSRPSCTCWRTTRSAQRGSYHAAFEAIDRDPNQELVVAAADRRSGGIGRHLIEWCIDRARQRGCRMVQLTSDKSRTSAIRFYEQLGFVASHEGLKLHLTPRR